MLATQCIGSTKTTACTPGALCLAVGLLQPAQAARRHLIVGECKSCCPPNPNYYTESFMPPLARSIDRPRRGPTRRGCQRGRHQLRGRPRLYRAPVIHRRDRPRHRPVHEQGHLNLRPARHLWLLCRTTGRPRHGVLPRLWLLRCGFRDQGKGTDANGYANCNSWVNEILPRALKYATRHVMSRSRSVKGRSRSVQSTTVPCGIGGEDDTTSAYIAR